MVQTAVAATKRTWATRSFGREMASLLLGLWGLITLLAAGRTYLFPPADPALLAAMGASFGPMYSTATTMIITFAGFTFGYDKFQKSAASPVPGGVRP